MKRRPLLALIPFWLFLFFFKTSGALHYTLLPVLGERLMPVWVIGLLISGAGLFQMLSDVPAGYLLDRYGYIRTLRVSTCCFFLGACVLFTGITTVTLIISILLGVIGWTFFGPGADAYILVKADPKIAGRFMAMRDIMASAGVVVGMAVLPFILRSPDRVIALVLAVPFFLSLVALSRASKDSASVHAQVKISHQSYYIRRRFIHHVIAAVGRFNPVSGMLLLQRFSAALFYGIVWFVVPLMIEQMTTTGPLSFGLIMFDLAILFTGFFLGKVADSGNKRQMVFWGMLLFSVSALLLGFNFGILFIILGFMATTGDEMASVSLWAWLDLMDKEHSEDALVTGALTLSEDLGWTVGPLLAGLLFDPFGPTWTIVFGAIFIFGAWFVSTALLHTHPVIVSSKADTGRYFPRHKPHKH